MLINRPPACISPSEALQPSFTESSASGRLDSETFAALSLDDQARYLDALPDPFPSDGDDWDRLPSPFHCELDSRT